jgi:hypothetical protein
LVLPAVRKEPETLQSFLHALPVGHDGTLQYQKARVSVLVLSRLPRYTFHGGTYLIIHLVGEFVKESWAIDGRIPFHSSFESQQTESGGFQNKRIL